jgi:CRISPR-associated protein Cmr5
MAQTMEQKRAADAWACAQGQGDEYQKLAKGLPALIMNSGLMQVLAFLHEKGDKGAHGQLGDHLRRWLCRCFSRDLPKHEFGAFMPALMKLEPRLFQQVTTEALAWLRWARQIAPAAARVQER